MPVNHIVLDTPCCWCGCWSTLWECTPLGSKLVRDGSKHIQPIMDSIFRDEHLSIPAICWQLEAMPQLVRYGLPIENGEFRWARCYSTWGFFPCRKLEAETSIFFTLLWSDHGKIVMGEIEALRWCAIGGSRLGRSFLCEVNLKCTSCRIDQPWAVNRLATASFDICGRCRF